MLVAGLHANAPADLQVWARRRKNAARQAEIHSKKTEAQRSRRAAVREARAAALASAAPPSAAATARAPTYRPPPRSGVAGSGGVSAPATSRGAPLRQLHNVHGPRINMHVERIHIQPAPVKPPGDPIQPAPLRATLRRQQLHEHQQWQALQRQRQRQQQQQYEQQLREQHEQRELEAAFEAKLHREIQRQQQLLLQQPGPQGQQQGQWRTQYTGGEAVATSGQLGSSGSQSQLLRVSPSDIAAAVEEAYRSEAPGSLAANKRALESRLAQLRQERQRSPAFALYAAVRSGADIPMRAPPALPPGVAAGAGACASASPARRMPPAPPAGHLASAVITNPQPVAPGLTFRNFAISGAGDEPEASDEIPDAMVGSALASPPAGAGSVGGGTSARPLSTVALMQARRTPPPPAGSVAGGSSSPSRSASRPNSRPTSRPASAGPSRPLSRPGSAGAERTAVKLHVTELQVPSLAPGATAGASLGHPAGLDFDSSPAAGLKATANESCAARLPPGASLPSPRARSGVPAPPSSPTPDREGGVSAFAERYGTRSEATQPPHA